jgi:hypothetical protein
MPQSLEQLTGACGAFATAAGPGGGHTPDENDRMAAIPQRWEADIGDIHRTFGCNGEALVTAENAIWIIQNSVLPVGAAATYAEHYGRLDYPLAAVSKGPVGVVHTGSEHVVRRHNS